MSHASDKQSEPRTAVNFGGPSVALAVIYAAGTAAFIPAFKLTSVANVALIWSAAPVLAGALGWWIFGQRMTVGFMLACASVLAGTAIIVRGSFGGSGLSGDPAGRSRSCRMAVAADRPRRHGDHGGGAVVPGDGAATGRVTGV